MKNFSTVRANHSLNQKNAGQFLKINKTADTSYVVLDSLGKIEIVGKLDNTRKINIQSLQRGIYFVQFSNSDDLKNRQHFIKL